MKLNHSKFKMVTWFLSRCKQVTSLKQVIVLNFGNVARFVLEKIKKLGDVPVANF